MTDERPDSLAAQAASWVPPWERATREPDRAYQAAARAEDPGAVDDDDDFDEASEGANPPPGPTASAVPEDTPEESRDESPDEDAEEVPAELAPLPGEAGGSATVDSPTVLPGDDDLDPTDVGGGPDLPVPASIEEATEGADDDEPGAPVDAPLPADGDDAGDVFDAAADDEVGDGDDVDLPFEEEVPAEDDDVPPETRPAQDEPAEDEPALDEPAQDEPAQDEPAQDEPAQDEPAQDEPARDQAGAAAAIPTQGRGREPELRTEDEPAPLAEDADLRAALESILLVVDEPVAEMQLAQILEQPTERVATVLEDISARYTAAGHGFDLRRAAGGWRLYTRPEYAAYVERFVLDGQSVRLTQAALETLAVVAYKQPVTRSRISAIRGVNCDGVMRTLVTRGLIEECGTEGETGAYLYRTTGLFLEKLGLNSVDQLPPLAPFLPDDVEEVLDASG